VDPEVGGRVGAGAEDHEQTMLALGYQSKREITRTKIRVRTAAHPTATGSLMPGRTRTRLTPPGPARAPAGPDPDTAPVVAWMFARRLAGHSVARITRALNDAAIPCPSAADPKRNLHRTGAAWMLGTVAAILANPRYTGRQVWNRQRTDADLVDPANRGAGKDRVISRKRAGRVSQPSRVACRWRVRYTVARPMLKSSARSAME
jgi:site-specific DNA recombinase